MPEYSLREVIQLAGLSRNIILRLVKDRIVTPARARGREYRFAFQDLIVLRAARALYASNISPRRIALSLRRLRATLPASIPLSGLRVSALGADVVVHDGGSAWQADTGQLLLDFDIRADGAAAVLLERPTVAPSEAGRYFERACRIEDEAPDDACAHYRRAIECDPGYLNAYLNLGCLLHERKRMVEAEQVYRDALATCADQGVLWYNLGVLHEDLGRIDAAVQSYRAALGHDPELADAHFNVARLYAALGRAQDALRAYNEYRRLQRDLQH
ncbi:MAG: tetratricopeptide repeat protein [Burkholderiales bacterium]|nr:tetratricopeptide repeat protein [Burkholderiales bacterium]